MTASHRATIIEPERIGRLLNAIDVYNSFVVVRYALKLTLLLFVRPGELRQAEWSETNWDEALWRIPAEKMKKVKVKIPHLVPLSRQAMELLPGTSYCDRRRTVGVSRPTGQWAPHERHGSECGLGDYGLRQG